MKHIILVFSMAIATIASNAQSTNAEKFAVKASAEIGLGNTISTTSSISSLSSKSSTGNYGFDFGWTFWKKQNNSLELNVGVAYTPTYVKLDLSSLDYSYTAPASADMDGDPYQRFYELDDLHQKVYYGQVTVPLYVTYAYKCNDWLGVHADLGMRVGFKTNSKVSDVKGASYSYGVYPQYEDLLINASYLNSFGTTNLADAVYDKPMCNSFSTSVIVGVGAEFRIYQHLAADLSFRYNAGVTNIFNVKNNGTDFTNESAPVNYTVTSGQQIKSLSDYLNSSKLGQFSLRVALIYRF